MKAMASDFIGIGNVSTSKYYWSICASHAGYRQHWYCSVFLQIGSVITAYSWRHFSEQSAFFPPYISLLDHEKPTSVLSVIFNLSQANTSIINSISYAFLCILWHFYSAGVSATWHFQCVLCFLAFYIS